MSVQKQLSRRDFIKLMSLVPGALAISPILHLLDGAQTDIPNVFIFILDAWSARNMSLHGYPRATMPNLEKFLDRSFVFHNHYSTGSYTVPGTASFLTGLYPWTHGAMHIGSIGVKNGHVAHNIFAALGQSLSTLGYAQNPHADKFLYQFEHSLDEHLPSGQFNVDRHQIYDLPIIDNDAATALNAFDGNNFGEGRNLDGSLFFEIIYRMAINRRWKALRKNYRWLYPKGMPASNEYFLLDQIIDGSIETLRALNAPTLAYFHYFPPHWPYTPTMPHSGLFDDGWTGPDKPVHPLSPKLPAEKQSSSRLDYDQYLASVDAELARLLEYLESSGLLDKSIVIFTSDHGEIFERGEIGHSTLLLADGVIHIPLLISLPGQDTRQDIHAFTSSVDVLPTIAHLLSQTIPPWTEGKLLPGLGGAEDANRSIFSLDAKLQSAFQPLTKFSFSIARQGHKLIQYRYPEYSAYEFYDLINDPEELTDLYPKSPSLALDMRAELSEKVDEINRQRGGNNQ